MSTLLVLLALSQYTQAEADALFAEANDASSRGDYATAESKYRKLLDAGRGSASVLYNLGTTALAAGDVGRAVLSLERARRIADDDDIEANLAVARERQVDQVVGGDKAGPFTSRLADALSEPLVSSSFLVTWWLAFLLAFLAWRKRGHARLTLALAAAGALTLAAALGGAVAIHAAVRQRVVEGVVLAASARAREFPGDTAKTAFEVHAGLKVRLLESSGQYMRIRLPNALEGWVATDSLEAL